jgi:hypothetical protein
VPLQNAKQEKKRVYKDNEVAVEKIVKQLEERLFTSGRAWLPLKGTTRQEEGTSLFLLNEVKRRTSLSKSFSGSSAETLSESSGPEYIHMGFLRA